MQRWLAVMLAFLVGASAAIFEHVLQPPVVLAHGGRTDSYGCHNDNQRREYHCHSGPMTGRTFASQAAMLAELNARTPASPVPPAPVSPVTPAPVSAVADAPAVPYDRDLYRHWIDADGDCQDTRQEVLISESLEPVELDVRGCRVLAGRWFDPYTGQVFTNPTELDVDHFIPLAEIHRSGGDRWSPEERERYANDLFHRDTLIAVSASANRSKGDRDPAQWLPPNESYRCTYVRTWVVLKATWQLTMDEAEQLAVAQVLAGCR